MLTNKQRWQQVATVESGWSERTALMSQWIEPGSSVLDIGCGNQYLANLLPSGCKYLPVDCVAAIEGTFVVDYNEDFALPDKFFDTVVMSGFIEYLISPEAFFQKLRKAAPYKKVLASYASLPREAEERRHHGWLNDLGNNEAAEVFFSQHLDSMQRLAIWRDSQIIVVGSLRL